MISKVQQNGWVVELFLCDGTPDGKMEANLINWSGELVRGNSSHVEWLLEHDNAKKPGVYLLQGKDPNSESETQQRIYIGRSDKIKSRLRGHASDDDKGFWETACMITTSDNSLYGTRCDYIEAMLIERTVDANRVTLHNKQKRSTENIPLPASGKQIAEVFLQHLEIVLPILNFNFLKKLQSRTKEIKYFMFELFHKDTQTYAKANEVNGDFFVLKDSHATTKGRMHSEHRLKRQFLIDKGYLKKDGTRYIFTRDVLFSSPSTAASIVIDGQASGWREWKIKGTEYKKSYKDWRENPEEYKKYFIE